MENSSSVEASAVLTFNPSEEIIEELKESNPIGTIITYDCFTLKTDSDQSLTYSKNIKDQGVETDGSYSVLLSYVRSLEIDCESYRSYNESLLSEIEVVTTEMHKLMQENQVLSLQNKDLEKKAKKRITHEEIKKITHKISQKMKKLKERNLELNDINSRLREKNKTLKNQAKTPAKTRSRTMDFTGTPSKSHHGHDLFSPSSLLLKDLKQGLAPCSKVRRLRNS